LARRDKQRRAKPEEPVRTGRAAAWLRSTPVLALGLFAFSWLLYANTLRNDFVWDDRTLVVENTEIRTLDWPTVEHLFASHYWDILGRPGGLYRPISALSFYVDYQLHGKDPGGYHLTNTLLNAFVCVLAFLLVLRLFGDRLLAFVTSLLFAALPLHTENVAWVAGRTDLIATLFMLASLHAYVWWRRRRAVTGWILSLLAFVAALLAKEFALVLPPLIAVLEVGPFRRIRTPEGDDGIRWKRLLLTMLAFTLVVAGYFAVRRAILGRSMMSYVPFATGWVDTSALAFSVLAHYSYVLAFPFVLSAESEFPVPSGFLDVHVFVGLVIAASLSYAVWRFRARGKLVLAVSIFAVGIAPVLNVIPITEVSADRFLYFPSLGACLAGGVLFSHWLRRRRVQALSVLILILAACGARTVARNADWRNEDTLFNVTTSSAPDNARAHLNLGNVHYRDGRYREALVEFRKALDIDPQYASAWSSSAGAYKELGQLDDAFRCMERALAIEPTNSNFHSSLGILYVQRNQFAEAIGCFQRALEYNPDNAKARFNLGLARYNSGDCAGAIRAFAEVPSKDVDFVHAYFYLAVCESKLGNNGPAADYASKFLELYKVEDDFRAEARAILSGANR